MTTITFQLPLFKHRFAIQAHDFLQIINSVQPFLSIARLTYNVKMVYCENGLRCLHASGGDVLYSTRLRKVGLL